MEIPDGVRKWWQGMTDKLNSEYIGIFQTIVSEYYRVKKVLPKKCWLQGVERAPEAMKNCAWIFCCPMLLRN